MDKSTILAMEAGEELDRLVAEEVMVEPMPEFTPEDALRLQLAGSPVKSPKGNWVCLCRYDEGDIPRWCPVPFSTDISAAWRVLEKLKRDWGCIDLIWDAGAWDISLENYDSHRKFYLGKESGATYEELPEAICRAALITRLNETKRLEGGKGEH